MKKRALSSLLLNLSMIGTALVFAPALYLRYRVAADPLGIVDGLLRLSWWWPLLGVMALFLIAGAKLEYARGLVPIYLPLLLTLTAVGVLAFGFRYDRTIIVNHPARELSSAEKTRLARGELVLEEADFSWVAPVARWSQQHLPRHPFGLARKTPLPIHLP